MVSICLPPDPLLFLGDSHKPHCASPCMQVSPVGHISPLKLKPKTDTNLHSGKSVGHQESTFVQRSSLTSGSHQCAGYDVDVRVWACGRHSWPRRKRRGCLMGDACERHANAALSAALEDRDRRSKSVECTGVHWREKVSLQVSLRASRLKEIGTGVCDFEDHAAVHQGTTLPR